MIQLRESMELTIEFRARCCPGHTLCEDNVERAYFDSKEIDITLADPKIRSKSLFLLSSGFSHLDGSNFSGSSKVFGSENIAPGVD